MAQCPYRVRDFTAVECTRTNCLMTAFEVLNADALYRQEIAIESEPMECNDAEIDWLEPHPEITQDHRWSSRLINACWCWFPVF